MSIEKYLNELKGINFFKHLDGSSTKKLFEDIDYNITSYKKNEIIFSEEELCTSLSIILQGNIEIQKIDSLGKILTVAQFSYGDTFGENLIFGDKNLFPMNVISKTNTIVLHIHKSSVVKLCQESTEFLYAFLKVISNRALKLNAKLKEVTLKTIRQKICGFLLKQYAKQKNEKIALEMSKKDWADKLGVQRPSLSRELIKMKEEGLIDYDKDTITILDLEGLETFN